MGSQFFKAVLNIKKLTYFKYPP